MTNAHSARAWFLAAARDEAAVAKHFVAMSTNAEAVTRFGIDTAQHVRVLGLGRRALFALVGHRACRSRCSPGMDNFEELLTGAHRVDEHFRTAPLEQNIPVIMGLLGIWYNNFFGAQSHAILPYDQYLMHFPAYFQQGDMESNGKSVTRDGDWVDYQTGPSSGASRARTGSTPSTS